MKRIIATLLGGAYLCLTAQAERVAVDVSVAATNLTPASVTITGIAAGETNWVNLVGLLVTMPTKEAANVQFYTQVGVVKAPVGDALTLNWYSSSLPAAPTVQFHMPRKTTINNRNAGAEPFILLGTNSSITVTQTSSGTNTWAFRLLIER